MLVTLDILFGEYVCSVSLKISIIDHYFSLRSIDSLSVSLINSTGMLSDPLAVP